jgi:hypothetical protein
VTPHARHDLPKVITFAIISIVFVGLLAYGLR